MVNLRSAFKICSHSFHKVGLRLRLGVLNFGDDGTPVFTEALKKLKLRAHT